MAASGRLRADGPPPRTRRPIHAEDRVATTKYTKETKEENQIEQAEETRCSLLPALVILFFSSLSCISWWLLFLTVSQTERDSASIPAPPSASAGRPPAKQRTESAAGGAAPPGGWFAAV